MTVAPDRRADGTPRLTRRRLLRYGSVTLVALGACRDDDAPAAGQPAGSTAADTASPEAAPPLTDAPAAPEPSPAAPVSDAPPSTVAPESVDCTVTPAFQAGPFYLDTGDVRRDVTEGLAGAPTRVRLQLVDAATCTALAGLPVDIWSAGPNGAYSGVDNSFVVDGEPDTTGETYLRGRQVADDAGVVDFETLYPGWYPVTAPHFHFTAPFDDRSSFTWQFFIDDAFSDVVYTTIAPYRERGPHPVRVAGDGRRIDPEIVVTPVGPAAAPTIDRVVAIDLTALTGPPPVFDG